MLQKAVSWCIWERSFEVEIENEIEDEKEFEVPTSNNIIELVSI